MRSAGLDPSVRYTGLITLPVRRPRRSLFLRYFFTLFIAVVVPLILGAVSEAWFGYREQRLHVNELLQAEARSAADRISSLMSLVWVRAAQHLL